MNAVLYFALAKEEITMKRKRKLSILLTLPMLIGTVYAPLNIYAEDETAFGESESTTTIFEATDTLCNEIENEPFDPDDTIRLKDWYGSEYLLGTDGNVTLVKVTDPLSLQRYNAMNYYIRYGEGKTFERHKLLSEEDLKDTEWYPITAIGNYIDEKYTSIFPEDTIFPEDVEASIVIGADNADERISHVGNNTYIFKPAKERTNFKMDILPNAFADSDINITIKELGIKWGIKDGDNYISPLSEGFKGIVLIPSLYQLPEQDIPYAITPAIVKDKPETVQVGESFTITLKKGSYCIKKTDNYTITYPTFYGEKSQTVSTFAASAGNRSPYGFVYVGQDEHENGIFKFVHYLYEKNPDGSQTLKGKEEFFDKPGEYVFTTESNYMPGESFTIKVVDKNNENNGNSGNTNTGNGSGNNSKPNQGNTGSNTGSNNSGSNSNTGSNSGNNGNSGNNTGSNNGNNGNTENPKPDTDPTDKNDKPSLTPGLNPSTDGTTFVNPDGTLVKDDWKSIDGKIYHFNEDGKADTGWYKINNTWYYGEKDGHAVVNSWRKVADTWYLFDNSGKMKSSTWHQEGNTWYYLNETGSMVSNHWKKVDGDWYFFNSQGAMQKGWYFYTPQSTPHEGASIVNKANGSWYYLDKAGKMKTGWLLLEWNGNQDWYFFDKDGNMMANTNVGIYRLDSAGKCLNPVV